MGTFNQLGNFASGSFLANSNGSSSISFALPLTKSSNDGPVFNLSVKKVRFFRGFFTVVVVSVVVIVVGVIVVVVVEVVATDGVASVASNLTVWVLSSDFDALGIFLDIIFGAGS